MARILVVAASAALASAASPWPPSALASAKATLALMSSDQKFAMVHGYGGSYVGNVPAVGPLSDGSYIPALHLHDGPQGVANGNKDVTCWPSALTVVQTWDEEAMAAFGAGMGREQFLKGSNVMLGPGVNLARVPWNGRNFEYQGEDPVLAARMVKAEVAGIQSQNVSGCVKHYVFNNEEDDRSGMSANVGNRAAKELYYKPFAAAVEAGVGSAMCSYNRVNRTWACEEANAQSEIHDVMGFQGWMMSDWGATHSTVAAANNGLDQQMPDASYFGAPLVAAVAAGSVTQATIDTKVVRILTAMYALNLMAVGNSPLRNVSAPANPPEHAILARELAEKSVVLLQNNGLLPFPATAAKTVAVFGDATTISGGGSGSVVRPYVITADVGIARFLQNASSVSYYNTQDPAQAAKSAAGADLVVMIVATDSSEGSDRKDLWLPAWQDAMVASLAATGLKLVVVARCPGACHMPWASLGMPILFEMLPGQESGNSIANTIFGDNNPSGRLPISFPAPPASGSGYATDTWLSAPGGGPVIPTSYPGTDRGNGFPEVDYTEELYMGYAWYDKQGTKPQWVFGHGLSYSTFDYSQLAVTGSVSPSNGATIYATICNTAGPAGAEVAQLYLGFPAAANEPPKLLKGFQKVQLGAGGCAGVGFPIAAKDLWTWDVVSQQWILTPGQYTVMVGSTSADIRMTGTLTVNAS